MRRNSLSGSKVRFTKEIGAYNEIDEEAKILENRRKYKKGGNSHNDVLVYIQV